jgi:tetratricopeptide (TPR) repeat protein
MGALEASRRLADLRREARAALGLARLERQKRNLDGATLLLDRAIVRLDRGGESRLLAELLLNRAELARLKGDLEEAQEGIEVASERFLEKDEALGAARARLARASLAEVLTESAAAESALRQVVREAEDLGVLAVSTDARLALADLWRRRGDLDRAARAYAALRAWALRQGRLEAHIRACLGASLTELARERFAEAWEASEEAARSLDQAPGHVLWARYRLVVARFLAQLEDQEQCWTWLWSAVELGLSDEVDLDTAEVASSLAALAAKAGWKQTSRQAAKVAIAQWERLGRSPKARSLYPLLSID